MLQSVVGTVTSHACEMSEETFFGAYYLIKVVKKSKKFAENHMGNE